MATHERALVTAEDVAAARPAVDAVARRTPVLSSRTISERAGGSVVLKAENLQRTGSFKIRGATAKLAALGERGCERGVVAASAGNHAQSLAAAARARDVPCEVFVPSDAPLSKVEAARGQGATVHVGGESVDECLAVARTRASEGGLAFVHPFDDPEIVAGQGSIGLELLEDVPDLAKVVVPVGGGGLCSGIAIAVKAARPDVEVVGVQAAACAPYPESLRRGEPVPADSVLTIADGIAVKHPGELTLELLTRHADEIVVVSEDETAEAMVVLMERCKLVVEARARSASPRCSAGRCAQRPPAPPSPCCQAGTSTRGCWPRSPAGTKARPAAGSFCSRACRTVPERWRACSRSSRTPAPTSSTSRTCARGSSCTCGRPASSSCSRRAGTSTRAG
jgi:threonine dehydratase